MAGHSDSDPVVQQIIVADEVETHENAVFRAATVSAGAYKVQRLYGSLPGDWDPWVKGRFTKVVRHTSAKKLHKLVQVHAGFTYGLDTPTAVAFAPMRVSALPKDISRLRVSGFDLPRTGQWPMVGDCRSPEVFINANVDMTTGKTCAQVAHGLVGWCIRQSDETLESIDRPEPWLEDVMNFPDIAAKASIVITDAGFTEITPGTATVAVL